MPVWVVLVEGSDESTILRFRHLLEEHKQGLQRLATIHATLTAKRLMLNSRSNRELHKPFLNRFSGWKLQRDLRNSFFEKLLTNWHEQQLLQIEACKTKMKLDEES